MSSFWKKEIHLRRKPKVDAPAPAEESDTPFWKKEIHLRRKPKVDAPAPAEESDTPFWKKEIHLRRKPKVEAPGSKAELHVEDLRPRPPVPPAPRPDPAMERRPAPPTGPQSLPEPPVAPRHLQAAPDEINVTFDLDLPAEDQAAAELSLKAPFEAHAEPGGEPEEVRENEGSAPAEPLERPAPFAAAPAAPPPLPEAPVESPVEARRPFALPTPEPDLLVESDPPVELDPPVAVPARVAARVVEAPEDVVEVKEPTSRPSRASRKVRRAEEQEDRPKRFALGRGDHKAQKIVGLKIGASQIAAARVSNNGSAELLQLARRPLEPGIVVAGELRDPDALATALKAFFKENKLPTRGIRLGLSNNRIGVRIFEIAGVDDPDQLKNAIRFRAQETLPIPIEDAVLDYHVLDEKIVEGAGLTRRVLLVVAYRDLIDRYVAACRKAGLRLAGIDLEAFALLRALGRSPDAHPTENLVGLVVVSVGHDRSTFAVSDGRVCEFARVLDWGGFSLNVAIARALDLRPSEAEPIKLGLSLNKEDVVPPGLTAEMAETARGEVVRALEGFARDLVSSLRFYQSQPDSLAIRELIITGGTAEMPGLAAQLERLLGVHVRVGDPLGRVRVSKRVNHRENVNSLAAAIGLGIED